MAASRLPEPGTSLGPCADPCGHVDCAETRKIAETECAHCDEPIGYEVRFYRVDALREAGNRYAPQVYAHARCEEASVACEPSDGRMPSGPTRGDIVERQVTAQRLKR